MDWDKQKAIRELGIPETLYYELALGFFGQSDTLILNLEKAFQERNFEGIAKIAHFIKGAAGNLRIDGIYLTVMELEALAKACQDLGTIERRIKDLKHAMEELKRYI